MNQMIAIHLNDQDLANFALVCRATGYAVQDLSFWRNRFLDNFDNPVERFTSMVQFRDHYKWRRQNLRVGDLQFASEDENDSCVAIVKDLLLGK
jgi:hypothetical protein